MDRDEGILHECAGWAWHFDDVTGFRDLPAGRFDGRACLDVAGQHPGVQALQHSLRRIGDCIAPVILLARRKPLRAIYGGQIAVRLWLVVIDRPMLRIALDQPQRGGRGLAAAHRSAAPGEGRDSPHLRAIHRIASDALAGIDRRLAPIHSATCIHCAHIGVARFERSTAGRIQR